MADSIQNRRSAQTYLRQVQQEQAQKKRELMTQQNEDIKALRQYYADEKQKIDEDSSATVNHIKAESNAVIAQEREEKLQRKMMEREEKKAIAEQARAERSERASQSSTGGRREVASEEASAKNSNPDAKTVYNRKGQRSPIIQNYNSKENDDFYRVQNRGSRVSENNQGYIIEAYAPEHEKDNLRVSIQRNKAVVSGQRKFNDEAQDGNKKMRTNNFQTFREEFDFARPVSHEGMTRERIGDYVRFTIPKLEAVENPDEES